MRSLKLEINGQEIHIEGRGSLLEIVADWSFLTNQLIEKLQPSTENDICELFEQAFKFAAMDVKGELK